MSGRPDAALTPDWSPGENHDPKLLTLPMWRRRPEPHVGWWTRWTTSPQRPDGVYS